MQLDYFIQSLKSGAHWYGLVQAIRVEKRSNRIGGKASGVIARPIAPHSNNSLTIFFGFSNSFCES
jgi:hypothetical protein